MPGVLPLHAIGGNQAGNNGFTMTARNMTPEALSKIIEAEISGDWTLSNAHDVDLEKCLIPPERRVFADSMGEDADMVTLWVVLQEDPEHNSGYMIVYGEAEKMFGLATILIDESGGGKTPTFLGYYGSFLETLDGM